MTRGKLAARTGCNAETIRYYERIGLLPAPPRTRGGHRIYDDVHERRLRFILRGRTLGFAIGDLGGLLSLVDDHAVTCAEVKALTVRHLEEIRAKIADLKRLERALADITTQCDGSERPDCAVIDRLFARPEAGAGAPP
jgi:MerR family mercuric resistance operon transcriptional regulator